MNIDLTSLPEFLKTQRWFAGKAWPIKSIALVDHAPLPGPRSEDATGPSILAVLEVQYQLGAPERYLLLVEPQQGRPADAMRAEETARGIFELMRGNQRVQAGPSALVGELVPGSDELVRGVSDYPAVRHIDAEQSNTSLVLDEKIILKLIRKLESGASPEYEIGRFLMTRTSFRKAPELVGALHIVGQSSTTVAVAHRYIPGAVDGWMWTLDTLARGEGDSPEIFSEIGRLGQTAGELHRALASAPDDPAFAPEPVLPEDCQRWSANIVGELGVTLAIAEKRFPALADRREILVESARQLTACRAGGKKIRIHGDLHLGQVLRERGEWRIFDFEGEPSRAFPQRREKQTPLKDLAGLVRSLSYAAATSERAGKPVPAFAGKARKALLDGYLAAVEGADLLPSERGDTMALLHAMELEKALYEVRYEMSNRPDWADIPVAMLLEGAP